MLIRLVVLRISLGWYEIKYLEKHPWSFNWIAFLFWLVVTGIGVSLIWYGRWILLSAPLWIVAVYGYFYLKVKLNRRRPEVMKRFREYYRSAEHFRKR